jgi:hypothetical protein
MSYINNPGTGGGGGGGGLTSINGQVGPAITVSAGTGIAVASGGPNNIQVGDFTVPGLQNVYVDVTLGSDSNNGMAPGAGHAWQTLQHAIDVVMSWVIYGKVAINFANGTYQEGVVGGYFAGGGFVELIGQSQAGAIIDGTLSNGFGQPCFTADGGFWSITNCTVIHGNLININVGIIDCSTQGYLEVHDLTFGNHGSGACLEANAGGYILVYGTITVTGTGQCFASARASNSVFSSDHPGLVLSVDPLWPQGCLNAARGSFIYMAWDGGVSGTSSGYKYITDQGGRIVDAGGNTPGASTWFNVGGNDSWVSIGNVITYAGPFVGDTGSGGSYGLVPKPVAGDATKFLRGDATWQTVTGGTGAPGGVNMNLQFNDIGSFGGFGLWDKVNHNIGCGGSALLNLTTGINNVAVGYQTGAGITTGNGNTIVGANPFGFGLAGSLSQNVIVTDGYGNKIMWADVLNGNNVFGYGAGNFGVVSGGNNSVIGTNALQAVTTGSYNSADGPSALINLTTGGSNVAIGNSAASSLVSGSSNLCVGSRAGIHMAGGENSNVYFNSQGVVGGNNNLGIQGVDGPGGAGTDANVGIGAFALVNLAGGQGNVGLGTGACENVTTGINNVGMGPSAATGVTTGNYNFCLGSGAGANIATGGDNICIGRDSGAGLNATNNNILIGLNTMLTANGSFNVVVGNNAIGSGTAGRTANYSICLGLLAGYNLAADNNIIIGTTAAQFLGAGTINCLMGYQAGLNFIGTESYNTIVGAHQGTTGWNNHLVVADGQGNVFAQGDNTGAMQFPRVGTTASAANAFLDSGSSPVNNLLRSTSSLRYKTAVREIPQARIDAIAALRPIEYSSLGEHDDPATRFVGYAAEDVAAIDPALVCNDADGRPDGVMYDRVLLLKMAAVERRMTELEAR